MNSLYDKYKTLKEWAIVEMAIKELIKNKDLQITTNPEYIIGHIVKSIEENKS